MTAPEPSVTDARRLDVERAWLAQIRAGDARGFEAMFRAYVAPLRAFADSYVHAGDDAEELVQDVFYALWQHRFTVEMPRGMGPYLYVAVRNRALNVLRSRAHERSFQERLAREQVSRDAFVETPRPESELNAREFAAAVDRVVAGMPPRCREVFALLRHRQVRYAEAAAILGISQKTVEVHMTRALAILRERLASWR